jgi:hypothetical protein
MTNEQRRRASGAANTAERRASDGGSARKAAGDAMVERRTGKSQVEQINAVMAPPKLRKPLNTLAPRGALPAQTSPGIDTPNPVAGGAGGGIASPLAEGNYALREYWPNGQYSNDGLLTIPAIKKIELTDADGNPVTVNLAQPA